MGLFVSALSVAFLFSCDSSTASEDASLPTSAASRTFQKLVGMQVKYAKKSIEVVSLYADLNTTARAFEDRDFEAVGDMLPQNAESLKCLRPSLDRGSTTEEVTLGQELLELQTSFDSEFEAALPDHSPALTLPYIKEADDGSGIKVGDDSTIPYKSLEGAIAVEILNAAAGNDVDSLTKNLELESTCFLANLDEGSTRGVYEAQVGCWAKGVLNYRWGAISDVHRAAVETAMTTWTNATDGLISFNELSESYWHTFLLHLHVIGYIDIEDNSLNEFTDGRASVGYSRGYTCYLKIKTGLSSNGSLKRVPLHELGHCIGLRHEHQRYDRDNYVLVLQGGGDFDIIPESVSNW